MKLKRQPEDFRVEELTDFALGHGEFAVYRLVKRGLGTPEAIEEILRRWKLERRQISYGGLKDRHALTTQWVTIYRGPARGLQHTHFQIEYLGRASRPFQAADIRANRFAVTLRSLSQQEVRAAEQSLDQLRRCGVPNYFDDQRFGSLGATGEYIARPWIAGDYERAVWLALADPCPADNAAELEEKRLLRDHWGDWPLLKQQLDRSHRRSIVTYLCDHPQNFRGAIARLRVDLRSIYVAAFQSALWNRLLADLLEATCPEHLTPVTFRMGALPFYRELTDVAVQQLRDYRLPLPSARLKLGPGPVQELVEQSLARQGLALREIRLKYPRDTFFSKGWRDAILSPVQLQHEHAADELYRGREKLTIRFELGRGAYATMLVKRITLDLNKAASDA